MRTRASTPLPFEYAHAMPPTQAIQGGMPFNPFEVNTGMLMSQAPGLHGVGDGMGMNGHGNGTMGTMGMGAQGAQDQMLGADGSNGFDMFGNEGHDFWSWLSSEGQSFSPLVDTLDTFDSSLAMGGI